MSRGPAGATEAVERSGWLLNAYVSTTFAAGLAVWVWGWPRVSLTTALAFAIGLALAELLPARLGNDVLVDLSNVAILVAVLVGGPALAVVMTVGVLAGSWASYRDKRLLRTLFNAGQFALSGLAAGWAFLIAGGVVGAPQQLRSWVGLLAAALVFTLVNTLQVSIVVRLSGGDRVSVTVGRLISSSLVVLQLLYAGLSILAAALLIGIGPAALILLLVPALVARHALRGFQHEVESYDRLVSALLKAIEVRDGYTRGHTDRVSQLCVAVARELGFGYDELRAVRYAAKLHDIGKLAVPISVINKPGPLDDDEFALIKTHPVVGADILAGVEFLRPILDGVRYHHERVDGCGYPHRVSGEDLPLVARIITVCDAFDAMTSTRSYRPAMELHEAFAELLRCAGSQFDGEVVEVLASITERMGWQPTREFTPHTEAPIVRTADPVPAPA
ncbi:MAG: HD-GYP domain-containing protein [Actinobacteria bacterium]|nr:HD-GYP domain-containing protein [Actinomycetota bacterium]